MLLQFEIDFVVGLLLLLLVLTNHKDNKINNSKNRNRKYNKVTAIIDGKSLKIK